MKKKPTLSGLKKKAWKVFSEFIRRRDSDEGGTASCYTCGALLFWREGHAGHGIPGRTNSVLLDPELVKFQCPPCNIWKRGMHHIFATKLIKEHGMEWWDAKVAGARRVVKYTRSDLEDLISEFKQKLETL